MTRPNSAITVALPKATLSTKDRVKALSEEIKVAEREIKVATKARDTAEKQIDKLSNKVNKLIDKRAALQAKLLPVGSAQSAAVSAPVEALAA